jgi:methenyltetrahydromethanopterin cyclohydrolase
MSEFAEPPPIFLEEAYSVGKVRKVIDFVGTVYWCSPEDDVDEMFESVESVTEYDIVNPVRIK